VLVGLVRSSLVLHHLNFSIIKSCTFMWLLQSLILSCLQRFQSFHVVKAFFLPIHYLLSSTFVPLHNQHYATTVQNELGGRTTLIVQCLKDYMTALILM
jgi:hypothetical protein